MAFDLQLCRRKVLSQWLLVSLLQLRGVIGAGFLHSVPARRNVKSDFPFPNTGSGSFIEPSRARTRRIRDSNIHDIDPTNEDPTILTTKTRNDSEDGINANTKTDSDTDNSSDSDLMTQLAALQNQFSYEGRMDLVGESYRSGFVSLVGAPNMGKSTLVNALLDENLCITTRRPQTTRHAIIGILSSNEMECQACLVDTPGILETPAYKLQEGMMEAVQGAYQDANVVVVVTDVFSTPIPNDAWFQTLQRETQRPIIVVINKVDLVGQLNKNKDESSNSNAQQRTEDNDNDVGEDAHLLPKTTTVPEAVARWRYYLPHAMAILPANASRGASDVGVQALKALVLGGPDVPAALRALGRPIPGMFVDASISNERAKLLLPPGPPLYDPEQLTDRTERFVASEIIRAALLECFQKELPYSCEVQVTAFKEQQPKPSTQKSTSEQQSTTTPTSSLIKIGADICVERDSQKIIVIGAQGAKIKEVGTKARIGLEDFFQTKVFLQLNVKVDKDWRKREERLQQYGYLRKRKGNSSSKNKNKK